jgi:hypothetical protein
MSGGTPRGSAHDATDLFMMYMIFSLLDRESVAAPIDAAAVHMTLGINETIAKAGDIDLAAMSPQLDIQTLDSLNGIDGINLDAGSLDAALSGIDVNVPDINIPDVVISMPDISIDVGGFSGGFDGGFGGGDF